MERTAEEVQALDARDAIWMLSELDQITRRHGWAAASFGISTALEEMKSIAERLPPAPPARRGKDKLPPDRRRR